MFIPNKICFTNSGVTCSVISISFLHIQFEQYPLSYFLFENIMNNTFGSTHSLFQKWVISKSVWSPCLPQNAHLEQKKFEVFSPWKFLNLFHLWTDFDDLKSWGWVGSFNKHTHPSVILSIFYSMVNQPWLNRSPPP